MTIASCWSEVDIALLSPKTLLWSTCKYFDLSKSILHTFFISSRNNALFQDHRLNYNCRPLITDLSPNPKHVQMYTTNTNYMFLIKKYRSFSQMTLNFCNCPSMIIAHGICCCNAQVMTTLYFQSLCNMSFRHYLFFMPIYLV